MKEKAITGQVIYSSRAFHQDATEAMGGDIVRALIETITNSDDSYGNRPGKIRVEIEHRRGPWKVITRDQASGMSAAHMENAIAQLGGRTSGFSEGGDVRGNLGRGSKDLAAFGRVVFESIHNDEFARMTLEPDGSYTLDPSRLVETEDRVRLGIQAANGTVVTIFVTESIRCPQHTKLVAKLSSHYQLRDIMADPNREITLVDLNSGKVDVLHYAFPSPKVELEVDLALDGYPDASARLIIYRNAERYDHPPYDVSRPAGILVKGRRAIYENTLFRFENNPVAGWFSGRLICPYIDDLAREYDRRLLEREPQDPQNPIPIITRRRDGLQRTHPFYRSLTLAVEDYLGPLVAEEDQKSLELGVSESKELRRMLSGLSRDLTKLIVEDFREIEEDNILGSGIPAKNLPPIRIVPEEVVLYMGEEKKVSLIVVPELCGSHFTIEFVPEGVVDVRDGLSISLSPHKKRPDLLVGEIHLRPLLEDLTELTVRCDQLTATTQVEVRSEREPGELITDPITCFQFEYSSYHIAWKRQKKIRIFAPLSDIQDQGINGLVSSSSPGVLVRNGEVKFALDKDKQNYVAEVSVEAKMRASQVTLTARLGGLTTTCLVVVTREERDFHPIDIRIVDKEAGNYRALVEQEAARTVINIMGLHPVMRRYRGPAPDFPGNDQPTTKMLIAEIVSDQVARMIVERKFMTTLANEPIDAARLYSEHYTYLMKYLARCHKALLSDAELNQLQSRSTTAFKGVSLSFDT